jgi:hypothetical protein
MDTRKIIHIAHILILGPLLIAVGTGYIPPSKYVSGLGIAITLYHVFRMFSRGINWVNMFHALTVGPALIAYGLGAPRYVSELTLILGIAAVGYHLYYLARS